MSVESYECDGTVCADLPHVVISLDPEDALDPVLWGILPNHAEWLVAKPEVDRYADATEGVEIVFLRITKHQTGAEMAAGTADDIAYIEDES